jgi:hypothetical protein
VSKIISKVVLIITGLLLTACTTLDTAALQPNKRYAVVSFYYDANILPTLGHYGRPVKIVDEKGKHLNTEADVRRIADAFAEKFLPAFAKSVPFKVIYGSQILRHGAYAKAAPQGSPSIVAFKAIPATGYHVFQMGDFDNIGQLARDLNVDGVLVIYHHFAASSSDNDLSNANPGVISVIGAFDREGKTVLQDYTSYTSRATVRSKPGHVDIGGVTKVLAADGDEVGRNLAKYITSKLSAK